MPTSQFSLTQEQAKTIRDLTRDVEKLTAELKALTEKNNILQSEIGLLKSLVSPDRNKNVLDEIKGLEKKAKSMTFLRSLVQKKAGKSIKKGLLPAGSEPEEPKKITK